MPSSDEEDTFHISGDDDDDDDDEDFIPTKKKRVDPLAKSKQIFGFEREASDGENSEVERTKELIKKLTPVKQSKSSSSSSGSGKEKSKKVLMSFSGEASSTSKSVSDVEIIEEESLPPISKSKNPVAKKAAAPGMVGTKKVTKRATKKATKHDEKQTTLFSSVKKAAEKRKLKESCRIDDEDDCVPSQRDLQISVS